MVIKSQLISTVDSTFQETNATYKRIELRSLSIFHCTCYDAKLCVTFIAITIKGVSRRAKKSRKVLMMMMKAAKSEYEQDRSRAGVMQERG